MQNAVKARFSPGAAAPVPPRMLTHPLLKVDTQYPKGAGPALPLRQIVLAQSQILTAFFTGLCELTTYEMKRPLKNGSYSKTRVGELQLEALLQQS